jgi:uncharacterized membrane protein
MTSHGYDFFAYLFLGLWLGMLASGIINWVTIVFLVLMILFAIAHVKDVEGK